MAITPDIFNEALTEESFEIDNYPSKTYRMELEKHYIRGKVDGIESIPQVIYKILYTERSQFLAYSDNYGIELDDLYGKPVTYVLPELERRIKEALEWDSRINSVDSFVFIVNGSSVTVTFTVHTIFGDVESERTVQF